MWGYFVQIVGGIGGSLFNQSSWSLPWSKENKKTNRLWQSFTERPDSAKQTMNPGLPCLYQTRTWRSLLDTKTKFYNWHVQCGTEQCTLLTLLVGSNVFRATSSSSLFSERSQRQRQVNQINKKSSIWQETIHTKQKKSVNNLVTPDLKYASIQTQKVCKTAESVLVQSDSKTSQERVMGTDNTPSKIKSSPQAIQTWVI